MPTPRRRRRTIGCGLRQVTGNVCRAVHHHDAVALDKAFPAQRGAAATVTLRDGRTVTGSIANAKGEPEDPLFPEEVYAKFRSLATPVLGAARAGELEKTVRHLEQQGSTGGMAPLMVATAVGNGGFR